MGSVGAGNAVLQIPAVLPQERIRCRTAEANSGISVIILSEGIFSEPNLVRHVK